MRRPTEAWSRVRTGSQAHAILETIQGVCEATGRGATITDVREAYPRDHGEDPPGHLASVIHDMKKRGVLVVVGGRPGHMEFVPAGSRVATSPRRDDEVFMVLQAFQHQFDQYRKPVSTRDVLEEFRSRFPHHELAHENTVRKHLETLSSSRKRGPEAFRSAKLKRVPGERKIDLSAVFWAPAGWVPDTFRTQTVPRSAADAIRRAVLWAERRLRRPVSTSELRWWADGATLWARLGGKLSRDELGRVLAKTAQAESGEGRLQVVTTRFTCHGGAPRRYAIEECGDIAERLCLLTDISQVLRLAKELNSIRNLELRNRRTKDPALQEVCDIRRSKLASVVTEARGPLETEPVSRWIERTSFAFRLWVREADLYAATRESRKRGLASRLRNLEALDQVLEWEPRGAEPTIATVGESALMTRREADHLLELAGKALGIEVVREKRNLIRGARRLPLGPTAASTRFGPGAPPPLAAFDRVDVIASLWECFPVPTASTLIRGAHTILGRVVRDPAYFDSQVSGDMPLQSWTRRVFVVALGMLGRQVPSELAVPDTQDYQSATAWALSTILADPESAGDNLDLGGRRLRGPAARVVSTAQRRVRGGHVFSAVG